MYDQRARDKQTIVVKVRHQSMIRGESDHQRVGRVLRDHSLSCDEICPFCDDGADRVQNRQIMDSREEGEEVR